MHAFVGESNRNHFFDAMETQCGGFVEHANFCRHEAMANSSRETQFASTLFVSSPSGVDRFVIT